MRASSKSKVLEACAVSDLHSVLHSDRKFRVRVLYFIIKLFTLFFILIYTGYFIFTMNPHTDPDPQFCE